MQKKKFDLFLLAGSLLGSVWTQQTMHGVPSSIGTGLFLLAALFSLLAYLRDFAK